MEISDGVGIHSTPDEKSLGYSVSHGCIIPEGYNHVCCVALGYMDGEKPEEPPRDRDVINFVR
jgi:hypothetical protein